jgi:HlyD family secretion protein
MNRFPWIAGIFVLAVTVVGASWALNNSSTSSQRGPKHAPEPPLVVIFGKVDGELGVIPLMPVQPGEVVEAPEERASFKEGDVVLKMDPTLAQLRYEEADRDLKGAEGLVAKAKQGLKLLENKKAQQSHAITAALKEKESAKNELDHRVKTSSELIKLDPLLRASLDAKLDQLEAKYQAEKEKLKELDLVKADIETDILRAMEDVEAKKLQKARAKFGLEKCEVRAPYDGRVLQVNVKKGQLLTGQERIPPILFLPVLPREGSKSTPFFVKGEVIQEWASRVKKGMTVHVEDDAYQGDRFEGTITRLAPWMGQKRQIIIEPFMTNDQNTVECTVEITKKLKPDGTTVDVGPDDLLIGQRMRIIVLDKR